MTGTYIVYKRIKQNGKFVSLYLSTTGKWIKSSGGAVVNNFDAAELLAKQHMASFRIVRFRSL